jgi:hypothetical protein
MRLTPFAASVLTLLIVRAAPAPAQDLSNEKAPGPLISTLPADVIRDLPVGDSVYSALETMQPEVISDRFNNGGLNVAGGARLGGFLGSWTQTLFRVGDVDVSDPGGDGSALLFPEAFLWDHVEVVTALMPADVNTPGLAVTLQPRRSGRTWTRMFTGTASGGSLAASAPTGHPVPITRVSSYGHGSGLLSGPVAERVGLTVGGAWARGESVAREQRPDTRSTRGSGFAHLVFTPNRDREWRLLGWVQRSELPFEHWQTFGAPAASSQQTAVHVQSTLEARPADAAAWRVFAGLTQRERNHTQLPANAAMERITGGPVPNLVDSMADTDARRLSFGARLFPHTSADGSHRFDYGATLDLASLETSNMFAGRIFEQVNGFAARLWNYAQRSDVSRRGAATAAVYARDLIKVGLRATADVGVRAELVHGSAEGASESVTWVSLLPRASLRWPLGERRAVVLGYARSANALTQNWLAFGDPSGATATVAAARAPNVIVSRVGPGTEGDPSFSRLDADLKRPYTDEFVVGFEKRRSARTRYTLTGIARRQSNLLGVINTGVTLSDYLPIGVPDANSDWGGSGDDRTLIIYNRRPTSFGRDSYLLTNPEQEAATAFALRMSWDHNGERLFMLLGATAFMAEGAGGNGGYGPLENDQDVPGEQFTNPNVAAYARGRLFSDRAFTIKWTMLYRFPGDITVGGIARYQDGQPFSRVVVRQDLNQGAEAVPAYANGLTRYTFIGSLDLRVQKSLRLGPARLDAILDAYNLFTRNNSVEEYIATDAGFRTSIAIEPPYSVHLGLRVSF